jgi:hypothetical protein
MKMALKRKNGEFLVMPLKHVLSVMGHVNPPEPQTMGNMWGPPGSRLDKSGPSSDKSLTKSSRAL